jgi:hypothetical protein
VRRALGPLLALLLGACAALRPVEIAGGEVRNLGPEELVDLVIVHEPTRRSVQVNRVVPGLPFEIGFPSRELEAESARFTWRTPRGATRSTAVDLPPVPAELAGAPVWIVYVVRPSGAVQASWQRPPR